MSAHKRVDELQTQINHIKLDFDKRKQHAPLRGEVPYGSGAPGSGGDSKDTCSDEKNINAGKAKHLTVNWEGRIRKVEEGLAKLSEERSHLNVPFGQQGPGENDLEDKHKKLDDVVNLGNGAIRKPNTAFARRGELEHNAEEH